jgi:hypothetical protein
MGNRFFTKGKIELARRSYLKVQIVDENYGKLHLKIGKLYRNEQEFDGVFIYFQRACELNS